MLVLSRKRGESILIHTPQGTIRVLLLDRNADRVRLGIDAPTEVKVMRAELLEKRKDTEPR